jgi:hypothetical protein
MFMGSVMYVCIIQIQHVCIIYKYNMCVYYTDSTCVCIIQIQHVCVYSTNTTCVYYSETTCVYYTDTTCVCIIQIQHVYIENCTLVLNHLHTAYQRLAILLSAMALRQQIFPRCMQPCIFWRAYARKVSVVSFFVVTLHYA